MVVVVVVGPYRVFDGGVFAYRCPKSLAGAAFSALSATNLPGRPNAFFAMNLRRGPVCPLPERIPRKKKHVYSGGPLGAIRNKSNTRRTMSVGEVSYAPYPKHKKKHVYGLGPLGPIRKKSNTRRTMSIGEVP